MSEQTKQLAPDELSAVHSVYAAITAALDTSAGQIAIMRPLTLDDAQSIYQAGVTAWLDASAAVVKDETLPQHVRALVAAPVEQAEHRDAMQAAIMRAALRIAGAVAPVAHIIANTAANSATRDARSRLRTNDHPSAEKRDSKRD